ncbi:MAG: L-threonylcarbamoyladenylate synthase, partial [Paenibacillus sp.]|uniref:L-threonylcarbamoyladenylate synthase n=1 Tax=Paenibacillus sp. TaxID=58172 RepID=UPI0029018967
MPDASEAGEEAAGLKEAAAVLASGGTVAFPTETVYGLGADARNTAAVEEIFAAKGRPSDNPLIVHIADVSQLDGLVTEVNETARRLMEAFWPGPLTLVLPVAEGAVSPRVTAGLSTVGVRMPAHDVALRLIAAAGCPVAAPSANRSGRPSPTLASHVGEDLSGRIDGIVDGGPTGVGLESTVVEAGRDGVVTVLRPGGITAEQLAR